MRKTNFFIVGQAKCGTSALAEFLNEHPAICMSDPKEPGYFAKDIIEESDRYHGKKIYMKARTREEYEQYYQNCSPGQICGDATPIYFYSKKAAENIKRHNPNAKIIIMLRNPVDFMHSLHMQYVNDGSEDVIDFETAISLEPSRKRKNNLPRNVVAPSLLQYTKRAHYYPQIKRYMDLFPRKRIFFIDNDDFRKNGHKVLSELYRFLGVDSQFSGVRIKEVNGSKRPRNVRIHRALNNLKLKNSLRRLLGPRNYRNVKSFVAKFAMKDSKRTAMGQSKRKELIDLLREDVIMTSELSGVDFARKWGF